MLQKFNSLIDFQKAFSTETKCIRYLEKIRWEGKPVCPRCGKNDKTYKFAKVGLYACGHCRREFSIRKGTIFEDSKLPLKKWFLAFYLELSHSKGISSVNLAKDLDIHQESAWFLLQRIRWAITHNTIEKMSGDVELDETYVGGKESNKHKDKKKNKDVLTGNNNKMTVVGLLQRGRKTMLRYITKANMAHIRPILEANIDFDNTNLHTDESAFYKGYKRNVVNHSRKEYVRGNATTNGIENVFSLFKRCIFGIHHQISKEHIDKYINSFCFRYNNKHLSISDRFELSLSLMLGKRLTYAELVGE